MRVPTIGLAVVTVFLATASARAQEPLYPWCASYFTSTGEHGSCGYYTFEQCMSYVSGGLGGVCYRNPAYANAPPQFAVPRKKARRR